MPAPLLCLRRSRHLAGKFLLGLLTVCSSVSLAAADAPIPGSAAAAPVRKVLFIGIDGTRTDALEKARTPNIDKLAAKGFFNTHTAILSSRPTKNDTVSGPGWSSIFTGVWSDKHGVNDNTFKGSHYDQYPHLFTRLREVQPNAVTGSFCTWAPIHDNIVQSATVSKSFSREGESYAAMDNEVATAACQFLTDQNPALTCVYFGEVDEAGHAKGFHPSVPSYREAIEHVDQLVGQVMEAVKSRRTFAQEDWLVILTTDHGGRGLNHSKGHDANEVRQVWMIVSGHGVKQLDPSAPTAIVDIVPTALVWLRIPLKSDWKLDGQPEGISTP